MCSGFWSVYVRTTHSCRNEQQLLIDFAGSSIRDPAWGMCLLFKERGQVPKKNEAGLGSSQLQQATFQKGKKIFQKPKEESGGWT